MATDAPSDIVDEARATAAGSRKAAAWLASILGAVPGIALITTLVQKPDAQEWDPLMLTIGIVLLAVGGMIGLIAFARVFTPVPLTTDSLSGFDVSAIPGSRWKKFDQLSVSIEVARRAVRDAEANKHRADALAASAEALASRARAEADRAAKEPGSDPDAKARALQLQSEADELARKSGRRAADKAVADTELNANRTQFTRNNAIRKEAFLLKAGQVIQNRFSDALWATPFAVGLAAIGLAILALAPEKAETEEADAPVTLVRLSLNDAGRRAAGCTDRARTLPALRVGGTTDTPTVVTLSTANCPTPRLLRFKSLDDPALGTVAEVKATSGSAGP